MHRGAMRSQGRLARWFTVLLFAAGYVPASAQAPATKQPPAPYYSVQLMGLSTESGALATLKTVKDQPYARAELRDGFFLVRVGAYDTPEPARLERDAYRAKGLTGARVVKIARAVDWLLPDGSKLSATGQATAAKEPAAEKPAEKPAIKTAAEKPAAPAEKPAGKPAAKPAKAEKAAPPVEAAPSPEAAVPENPPVLITNAGGALNWGSTIVSFEQLGFLEGFALEGSEGMRRLYFPLPPGVDVQKAQLVFDIEWSPLLIPVSSIQFRVNDSIRTAIRRGAASAGARVEIPLTPRDLELNFVEVEIDYALWMSEDICLSRKLSGAYARFSLGSGLAIVSRDGLPRSVRGAWSLLPRTVRIASNLANLTPGEFQALFQLATALHREGFKVQYDPLVEGVPTEAHVVIAPAERYVQGGDNPLENKANLRLVHSLKPATKTQPKEERAFILVDSTRPLPPTDVVRLPWRNVSSGALLDVAKAGEWPEPRDADDVVRLKSVGFDDSERLFTFDATWHVALPFGRLGTGQRPARAQLEVYGPKVSELRGPTTVSAYFNDRLVYSVALRDTGEKQTLEFELPRAQLRARNNLKVTAQRDEVAADCKLNQAPYPLSISPNSVIETRPLNEIPVTFAELVPYQRGLELYIARDALAAADRVVPMLVGLGEHFWPDVPPPQLRLFDPGTAVKPAGPFFVVGDPKWNPEAWVRFQDGRVRLSSNATGEPLMLLDFASDVSTTVLQMVRDAGQGGAWLRATAGYASVPAKRTLFEDENVAFLGERGIQTSLRVGPARDYRVDYPDATSWFSATGQWRAVLFVIAWLVVVALLLYLFLRTRRHGRN